MGWHDSCERDTLFVQQLVMHYLRQGVILTYYLHRKPLLAFVRSLYLQFT